MTLKFTKHLKIPIHALVAAQFGVDCWRHNSVQPLQTTHFCVDIAGNSCGQPLYGGDAIPDNPFVGVDTIISLGFEAANLSSGFPTKRDSNQSPQRQRLASHRLFVRFL